MKAKAAWCVIDWGLAIDWELAGFKRYTISELDLAPEDGVVCVVVGEYAMGKRLVQQLAALWNSKEVYVGPERRVVENGDHHEGTRLDSVSGLGAGVDSIGLLRGDTLDSRA